MNGGLPTVKSGLRPIGGTWVFVMERRDARGFIGHVFAGDGMHFHRASVPADDGLAAGRRAFLRVEHRLGAVGGEHGVAALDVVKVFDDGLGRGDAATGCGSATGGSNPQDQLGDGGGARVYREAEELVRVHGEAGNFERGLLVAEAVEGVEDFAFETLEMLQRLRPLPHAGTTPIGLSCSKSFNIKIWSCREMAV